MAFKDIVVHVDETARAALRFEIAAALAARHQAHLVALNVRSRAALAALAASPYVPELDQMLTRQDAEAAAQAQAMVEQRARDTGAVVEWRDVTGDLAESVALHARYADLVVVGQTEPDAEANQPLPDALVLAVGRPVLVVPYAGRFPTLGRRVLVAWNASREATRAVHDALPILQTADLVHVLAINPGHGMAGHGDIPGADICLHLSRHGVKAVCEHIRTEDLDVGQMLLSRAADEDADLIVMGGYGRSRLREMVLGGATHHLLEHMTVPVLLSH